MQQLATLLAEFSQTDLGETAERARAVMRLSLLDWCAVGLAGRDEPASGIMRDIGVAEGGQGAANILGASGLFPARTAAMVNGVTSHALDYDDTHFAHIGHPSVAIIPAALAAAQTYKRSGTAFLDAALIGAEASVRMGLWLGRSHYQAGFHQTATAGAFGACCAVARLARLSISETKQALAITASRAAGLKAQFGSMTKPYHAGLAAQTGVEAVTLAKAGFTAQISAIDGAQGFGATHAGQENWQAFDGLSKTWLMEDVSHKFHACCHGTHAMIEALRSLPPIIQTGQITKIQIDTHKRWMHVCNIATPKDGLEVKFSYAHIAAMVLSGIETASLGSFCDTNAVDVDLVALAQKVEIHPVSDISETACRVTINTHTGKSNTAKFDLSNEMDFDTRRNKVLTKAQALLGQEATQEISNAINEHADDLGFLVQALFASRA